MQNKKGFYLYHDSLCILEKLSNEQAGAFLKAIYHYQTKGVLPENIDPLIEIIMMPFVNQFMRDEEKYTKACERNAINANKRWGNNSDENVPKDTALCESHNSHAKHADTKKDTHTKKDTIKKINKKSMQNNFIGLSFDSFDSSEFTDLENLAIKGFVDVHRQIVLKMPYKSQQALTRLKNHLLQLKADGYDLVECIDYSTNDKSYDIPYPPKTYSNAPPGRYHKEPDKKQQIKEAMQNCSSHDSSTGGFSR